MNCDGVPPTLAIHSRAHKSLCALLRNFIQIVLDAHLAPSESRFASFEGSITSHARMGVKMGEVSTELPSTKFGCMGEAVEPSGTDVVTGDGRVTTGEVASNARDSEPKVTAGVAEEQGTDES